MKLKHSGKIPALLLLMAILLLSFASCGGTGKGSDTTESTGTAGTEPETTVVVPDGGDPVRITNQWSVVYPESEQTLRTPIQNCRKEIKETCGELPGMYSDSESPREKEILVGKTNRPESEAVYEALGTGDYLVVLYHGKIVIAAQSTDALETAFRALATMYLNESGFEIPGTLWLTPSDFTKGETLQTFRVPAKTPNSDVCFSVTVNGYSVGIYGNSTCFGGKANMGYFNSRNGVPLTIRVQPLFNFESVEILPARHGLTATREGNVLVLNIDRLYDDLTFVFDGNYQGGNALHLFMNEIDDNAPTKSTGKIRYYGPGYYDLTGVGHQLYVNEGETLYLAPGCVINGSIIVRGSNAAIKGNGVIILEEYADQTDEERANAVLTVWGNHVQIEGITVMQRRNWCWTTTLWNVEDVHFERYRVMSTPYASTDGINPCDSENITIKNCFLRTCDDCIAIKGVGVNPARVIRDITVSDCTMWSDCNCIICIGAESNTKGYTDLTFKNLDVLFSYGDYLLQEKLYERAVMSMMLMHGTYVSNILYEDIRVNRCERLISLQFIDDFWFGTNPGDQTRPGGIENVTFRNITSPNGGTSIFSNDVQVLGYSADKRVTHVVFDHVEIDGHILKSKNDPCMTVNQYAEDLIFIY